MPKGRPTKYTKIVERLDEVEKLAGYGLIETEIADFLDISIESLSEYKRKYDDFSQTLKRGKIKADSNVIEKLYKRTQGYYYEEVTTEGKPVDKFNEKGKLIGTEIKPTFIKKVKKHIPPDVVACMCWLNNRRPQDWRQKTEQSFEELPTLNPEFSKMSNVELKEFVSQRTN